MSSAQELIHYLRDGRTIFFTLVRRRGIKHIYLYIRHDPRPSLEVRCGPGTPLESIDEVLRAKESWILRKLSDASPRFDYRKEFPWSGRKLPLKISIEEGACRLTLRLDDSEESALLSAPYEPGTEEIRSLYEAYYRLHAPRVLSPLVEKWSRRTGLMPSRVGFRKAKSRWGSCSSRDSLSLNTRLLLCPIELQEYVILHELCHIRHKNHSSAFWGLVERWLPDWKARRKALRGYEIHLY
jgi:predicted metal-dependent hydrolase